MRVRVCMRMGPSTSTHAPTPDQMHHPSSSMLPLYQATQLCVAHTERQ